MLHGLNDHLKGAPDAILSTMLIGAAILIVLVAMDAPPIVKAGVAAYVFLP